MSNINKNKFSYMGVVNATPDSFSDGGELLHLEALKKRLDQWQASGANWLDLGGESTAPFNNPVGHEEEWSRVSNVLGLFPDNIKISIDTFRKETILKASNSQQIKLWNDVSGQLDQELVDVLKLNPKLQTVFCHNLVPSRARCHEHMNFLMDNNDILFQLEDYFATGLKWFNDRNFKKPMLDLCFGFSKSFEQNWFILKNLPGFLNTFESKYGAQQWLVGISRKSFFKKLTCEKVDQDIRKQTEYMQASYLTWLKQKCQIEGEVIIRLHDPALTYAIDTLGDQL